MVAAADTAVDENVAAFGTVGMTAAAVVVVVAWHDTVQVVAEPCTRGLSLVMVNDPAPALRWAVGYVAQLKAERRTAVSGLMFPRSAAGEVFQPCQKNTDAADTAPQLGASEDPMPSYPASTE